MARPSIKTKSPLSEALIHLRSTYGESQQAFSNRLGLALNTIAKYESVKPPTGVVLLKFASMAAEKGRKDLVKVFERAFHEESGGSGPSGRGFNPSLQSLVQSIVDGLQQIIEDGLNAEEERTTFIAIQLLQSKLHQGQLQRLEQVVRELQRVRAICDEPATLSTPQLKLERALISVIEARKHLNAQ